MLWQLAYAELFFLKIMADFNQKDLQNVIKKFKKEKEILDLYDIK